MKKQITVVILIVFLIAFSVSCQVLSTITDLISSNEETSEPEYVIITATPQQEIVSLPAVTEIPSATEEDQLFPLPFYDDFSQDLYEWPTGHDEDEYMIIDYDYIDGVYTWSVTPVTPAYATGWPSTVPTGDFTATITARLKSNNAADCAYGLFYQSMDENDFITFIVGDKSFAGYTRNSTDGWVDLYSFTNTDTVANGGRNDLEFVREGDYYTFYVNGYYLADASYSDISEGQVGILVEALNTEETCVFEFDNYSITNP